MARTLRHDLVDGATVTTHVDLYRSSVDADWMSGSHTGSNRGLLLLRLTRPVPPAMMPRHSRRNTRRFPSGHEEDRQAGGAELGPHALADGAVACSVMLGRTAAGTVSATILDDPLDEGEEALTLKVRDATGARIGDGEAVGTIANANPPQIVWLSHFGCAVADHVTAAVADRLAGPLVTVGRRSLDIAETQDDA